MKNMLILSALIILLILGFYFLQTNKKNTLTQRSATPTQTANESPTEDQIIQALSQKNNWNASTVEVHITSVEGDYAKGDVKLKGEMGGGLWFAAKTNNAWKIVYDGNGIITCDQLAHYQTFPKDLIPTCYDKQTEKMITR